MPVLNSAAMLRQAKYVERNGFLVNHLKGMETVAEEAFAFVIFNPLK